MISDEKKIKKICSLAKQPRGAHGPWKQQLNMALANSKNETKQNLKKEGLQIKTVGSLQD